MYLFCFVASATLLFLSLRKHKRKKREAKREPLLVFDDDCDVNPNYIFCSEQTRHKFESHNLLHSQTNRISEIMIPLSSTAIRNASRSASSAFSKKFPSPISAVSMKQNFSSSSNFIHAEPMPAVAIAYDYEELDDFDDIVNMQKNENGHFTCSSSFQSHNPTFPLNSFTNNNTNTFTSTSIRKVSSSGGSGGAGSGGGRHKCPKCGMNVTFKHGDL